jgi:4-carboxymuconolactone decarboxylase
MSKSSKPKIDIERNKLGKKIRREVVGAEYDDQLQNAESDFSQPIRDYTTENLWGRVWADNTLSRKTRSLLNVGLTTAFRCSHETKVHIRGARNNGATREEIRAVLMQVMMYAGILAVREAVRGANQVFAEEDAKKKKVKAKKG